MNNFFCVLYLKSPIKPVTQFSKECDSSGTNKENIFPSYKYCRIVVFAGISGLEIFVEGYLGFKYKNMSFKSSWNTFRIK